jgi:mRNA interferase MazF
VVKRGQIWIVNLDPTVDSEIKKSRPCVVVSPADTHDHLRSVMVAPMTTKGGPALYRMPVNHGWQKGMTLLDQVRAVDKARLAKRLGAVSAKRLASCLSTLQEVFAELRKSRRPP